MIAVERPVRRVGRAVLVAAVVCALAAAVYYFVLAPRREAAEADVSWATGVAEQGAIQVTVGGTAALEQQTMSAKGLVAGTVRRVLVAEGDRVEAGGPLVELESETLSLALEQALLSYEAELERLAELEEGTGGDSALRAAELAVESARLSLETRERQVDDLVVRAPETGTVTEVAAGVGDEVSSGAQLATVLDDLGGAFSVAVSEARVADFGVGTRASVVFGPFPEVHAAKLTFNEASIFGLKAGDPVRAAVDPRWGDGISLKVEGRVVAIEKSGSLFEVTCRLPDLPESVPVGAQIVHMEIFPSGEQAEGVIVCTGPLAVLTDEWELQREHAEGRGLAAEVTAVASQGTRGTSGEVTYEVTVNTLEAVGETVRSGMTAHIALFPEDAEPLYTLSSYEAPFRKLTAKSGGKVGYILVRPGDRVEAGEMIVVLDNPTLKYQLEQARNELRMQEERLQDLQQSSGADRELRLQQIKLRQAEMALAQRQEDVDALVITAPISGRVADLAPEAEIGRQVAAGQTFCRVLSYEDMWLTILVDELEVVYLTEGMEAVVTVDAVPGQQFRGTVKSIAQEGQYSMGVSKFPVGIEVEGSDRLRAQMTARATIFVASKDDTLVVPAEAVTLFGDGTGEVQVVGADGTAEPRRVGIGLRSQTQVEIVSGLSAGETVITGIAGGRPGGPMIIDPGMGAPPPERIERIP